MSLRLLLVSFSFSRGGAATAARKFAKLALSFADVSCFCAEPSSVDDELPVDSPSRSQFCIHYIKRMVSYFLLKLMRDGNPAKHSLNLFSARNVLHGIKGAECSSTVLHLHWINNDTLSIWRLRKLPPGTVITLHDEWLYCGSEHYYPTDAKDCKFVDGYLCSEPGVRGLNWNRWIWKIKLLQLRSRDDLIFTVPSKWMLDRAIQSIILKDKDVRLLPNPIEMDQFKPFGQIERTVLRAKIGFSESDIVFTIGAVKGAQNPLKGFAIFKAALTLLRQQLDDALLVRIQLVMFGCGKPKTHQYCGFPVVNFGRINSTADMKKAYGVADCTVVPSLVESFGQISAESLACQTPVVAFRNSGIMDIVQHESNGYLAEPYYAESLANCLKRMINLTRLERASMGRLGREHVEENFSLPVVSGIYQNIITEALKTKRFY
ncbi:MAG: glycosyltransferase [Thiotrichales bacterium]|nr:glycosyltransferase [Thiotrichales bacterium]